MTTRSTFALRTGAAFSALLSAFLLLGMGFAGLPGVSAHGDSGRPKGAASASSAASSGVVVGKEVLVLEPSTHNPTEVDVFQEVTLKRASAHPWTIPLPYGASHVRPQSSGVTVRGGVFQASAGSQLASVAYILPATLGSVFAQNLALPNGQLAVLAGTGVYPGLGTGLTLHGRATVGGKMFVLFSGGASGPTNSVHFSLTAGHPGRPWSDVLDALLVIWIALGAYAGMQFLVGPLARLKEAAGSHEAG